MAGSQSAYDVLCYGAISMDSYTWLPYLPSPRRDVQADVEYDTVGGEALSVAIPLAAWGLRVLLTGNMIGTDRKADFIMSEVAGYPTIDTRYLRRHANVATPFARLLVTPEGGRSRINYWYDDAPRVELSTGMMSEAAILSIDAYGRHERERAATVARELGRPVITSDAYWPQYALASLSDVVILSRERLQAHFPGVYEYDHSLEMQERGSGVVIITNNDRPLLVVRRDGSAFTVDPYEPPGAVVDTSAAGHVFKAGIVYGWLKPDWSLEQKVRFACAAAALSCVREHAHADPPPLAGIEALLAAQPR
ncbi:MAG TPA: carbohydrate kinase family protein [Anaerolineae bacterium]